jgi:nucleotide-binding universal stress UspA family protein
MERWPRDILVVREAPTSAYHTVLACVALGPHSRNVVWSADALSRHARSYLFHAYAPPFEATVVGHAPNADAVASYRDETRRRAEKAVSELLDSCEVGRQFVTVLRYGSPAALIRRAVVRLQVDVAVLGRSQSAVDELLLGSVTKKVVRNVPCDVLIAGLHAASGA